MGREVIWSAWEGPVLEHLRLRVGDDEVFADGVIPGVAGACPFRVRYEVCCDAGWRGRCAWPGPARRK